MNKIHLLQVVTSYQSVVTILDSKLKFLKQNGIRCSVASSFDNPNEKRVPPVTFHKIEIPRTVQFIKDIKAVIELYKLIKKENFNIIHTHTAKAGIIGAIAGFLSNKTVIHTHHGLPFFKGQSKSAYIYIFVVELLISQIRTFILCQTKSDVNILKKIKFIRCPIIYEGNGIDIGISEKVVKSDKEIDNLLNKDNKPVLLCVSRLEPVKNLPTVLRVAEFLHKEKAPFQLIIAGKGYLFDDLQNQIIEMKLENLVSIFYTENIHCLISKSDVVILSSLKEGIPRGIMEAMAFKKPIVATDVSGTNELVVHNETGFLVPLGNQDEFNRCVKELLLNRDLQIKFGENGYKRVAANFNDETIVNKWIEIYKNLIPES